MNTYAELVKATAHLARASGTNWTEFTAAFDAHVEDIRDQAITAAPDVLVKAQGRAQLATELARLFKQAIVLANKINAQP